MAMCTRFISVQGFIPFLLLWISCVLPVVPALSQVTSATQDIRIQVMDSLLEATNGDLIGITLLIENNTTTQLESSIYAALPTGVVLLSPRLNDTIRVDARARRFIPVKFRISQAAASGIATIRIGLHDGHQRSLTQAAMEIRIREKRALQLTSPDNMKLMRHLSDSVSVPVQLRNSGNTDETIQLVASVPTAMGSRKYQRTTVRVPAGRDTTVQLGFITDKELFGIDQFQYNIAGMYDDQTLFGNVSISVQNASSSRSFSWATDPGYNWNHRQNRISLSGRNPFSANQSLYLDANVQFEALQAAWEFNTHMYQWGVLNQVPVITNTWLSYTRRNMNFTVGNIMENAEKYVNGRGARFNYLDSADNYQVTAGFANHSYDLLNQYGRQGLNSGYSFFSRYQSGGFRPDSRPAYSGTFLYDRDPLDNSESIVHASVIPLIDPGRKPGTSLSLNLGAGISRALMDTLHQYQTEPSLAVGANFSKDFGKYYLNSNNYYSTAHYPGNRRGSLQLNQRIGLRALTANYWLGYNRYQFNPGSFLDFRPDYYMLNQQIEVGVSWQFSPFVNISVIPNRAEEESLYTSFVTGPETSLIHLVSWRVKGLLNWRSRNNLHYGNLSVEGGTPAASGPATDHLSYRTHLTYNFWKFNLNLNYQEGSFSVFELINNHYSQTEEVYRMGANLNFNYANSRDFRSYIGLQYHKDSFSGTNQSAYTRLDWSVGPKTSLFGQAQFYRYRRHNFGDQQNLNFQVGITQSLANMGQGKKSKRGTLELFTYYDHNHNGVYDEGDEIASDKAILIGKTLFMTDATGTISYKKLPYGRHEIQVPLERGWHAHSRTYEFGRKSAVLAIPLQRSGTVTGRLIFDFDPRLSLVANTDLEGYTVTARSHTGYTTQTRTNARGEFMIFLPEGYYSITLNNNEFPEYVYSEMLQQEVRVEPGKINEVPQFILKVQERKIEVKRFGGTL